LPGQVLDDGLLHPPSPIIQPEYLDNLKANRSESSTSNPEVPEERRNSDLKHIELHYNADTKSIHSESPHTDRLKGSQVSGFSLFSELAKQRRPNLKITIPKTNTWNSKDSVLEEDSFKLPTIRDQEGENKQKAEGELGPQQVEGYFQDEPEQDLQDLDISRIPNLSDPNKGRTPSIASIRANLKKISMEDVEHPESTDKASPQLNIFSIDTTAKPASLEKTPSLRARTPDIDIEEIKLDADSKPNSKRDPFKGLLPVILPFQKQILTFAQHRKLFCYMLTKLDHPRLSKTDSIKGFASRFIKAAIGASDASNDQSYRD